MYSGFLKGSIGAVSYMNKLKLAFDRKRGQLPASLALFLSPRGRRDTLPVGASACREFGGFRVTERVAQFDKEEDAAALGSCLDDI